MKDRIEKPELIARVAQRLDLAPEIVEPIIEMMLDEIYQALKNEERVSLRNFGTFYVRTGRDTWTFKFNPSQKWRALFGWSSTYKGEL
ncbi:MAG: HU family DNA-binding protein [Anaerolineae bacterium]